MIKYITIYNLQVPTKSYFLPFLGTRKSRSGTASEKKGNLQQYRWRQEAL